MLRRHLPTALLASATSAAALLPQQSQAQSTCNPPCYEPTAAEMSVGATVVNTGYPPGDVRRYGAVGDGSTDDWTALQNALNAANAGGYVMYLPTPYKSATATEPAGIKSYYISRQLQKLQSFTCPNIRGDGYQYSRISYSGRGAAIYIQGGSGRPCGAVIEGLGFDGSSSSSGIEVDGQNELTIRDCQFAQNAVGVLLNNMTSGAFTEYVVAESCSFTSHCATALQYMVNGGNNSFHGSGLRNCLIQAGGANPVYIGAGAFPYNAPLSFQTWVATPQKTIIYNATGNPVYFHGTVTVESAIPGLVSGMQSQSQSPVLAKGAPVYLVGGVESLGYVNYGTFFTGFRAGTLGAESGTAAQNLIKTHPKTLLRTLTPGANIIANIAADSSRLMYVQLEGANYDYRCLVSAAHDGFGAQGFTQVIAVLSAYNVAGLGAPTFSVDSSGNFTITNPKFPTSAAPVTAYVDMMPFGLNIAAYLASAAEYGNVSLT